MAFSRSNQATVVRSGRISMATRLFILCTLLGISWSDVCNTAAFLFLCSAVHICENPSQLSSADEHTSTVTEQDNQQEEGEPEVQEEEENHQAEGVQEGEPATPKIVVISSTCSMQEPQSRFSLQQPNVPSATPPDTTVKNVHPPLSPSQVRPHHQASDISQQESPATEELPWWFGNQDTDHMRTMFAWYTENLADTYPLANSDFFIGSINMAPWTANKWAHLGYFFTIDKISIHDRSNRSSMPTTPGSRFPAMWGSLLLTMHDREEGMPIASVFIDTQQQQDAFKPDTSRSSTLYCSPVFPSRTLYRFTHGPAGQSVVFCSPQSPVLASSIPLLRERHPPPSLESLRANSNPCLVINANKLVNQSTSLAQSATRCQEEELEEDGYDFVEEEDLEDDDESEEEGEEEMEKQEKAEEDEEDEEEEEDDEILNADEQEQYDQIDEVFEEEEARTCVSAYPAHEKPSATLNPNSPPFYPSWSPSSPPYCPMSPPLSYSCPPLSSSPPLHGLAYYSFPMSQQYPPLQDDLRLDDEQEDDDDDERAEKWEYENDSGSTEESEEAERQRQKENREHGMGAQWFMPCDRAAEWSEGDGPEEEEETEEENAYGYGCHMMYNEHIPAPAPCWPMNDPAGLASIAKQQRFYSQSNDGWSSSPPMAHRYVSQARQGNVMVRPY